MLNSILVLKSIIFFLLVINSASASILVVAPHPDDDVLMASGVISNAISNGEAVTVVFMTNGDIYGVESGLMRQDEAVTALALLGTTENNLIFLGYPDGHLEEIFDNFIDLSDVFITPFGQSTTYGVRGLGGVDYHTYWTGAPATYNRQNIINDLAHLISTYRPDHILTASEYDTHPDHATTYQLLTMAITEVSTLAGDYEPTIHKTIIRSTAPTEWPLPLDPTTYHVEPPDLDLTDLQWDQRESLDVPLEMQATDLQVNTKYQAISAHESQMDLYGGFLVRFVHKDEIFWLENLIGSNQPPVVHAGFDIYAAEGSIVTLDGSRSLDSDGDPLSYQWIQTGGSAVSLSGASTAQAMFTAPSGSNETLTFQLTVGDGQFTSLPDLVNVVVQGQNRALNQPASASSVEGSLSQFDPMMAVDGDGLTR
ncbi:MAG: PIG-L family deacetylase, partial [Gammaproteobacteria bacterium]